MVTYSLYTNQGEREKNEDYIGYASDSQRQVFLLADGLGGHGFGDAASELVVSVIKEEIEKEEMLSIEDCIFKSQKTLLEYQKQKEALDKMKTTLVCMCIQNSEVHFYHIGDSRGYWFQHNHLKFHTLDHSVPQLLVQNGIIKENEIRYHPDRNRLLRVMGVEWEKQEFQISKNIKAGKQDSFLLCSDGFWELIDEHQMENCLEISSTPDEWIANMEKIIWENGKGHNMDNLSAIAVFVRNEKGSRILWKK